MREREILKEGCNELGIDISETQINQFIKYYELLVLWNSKINLTAITEFEEVIIKHFLDSLTITKYIKDNNVKIIDVGTGAGFPGLPLKIVRPDIELTLVDALNKRIVFLNDVVNHLELNNVITIHGRAEEIGHDEKHREKYDYCVSRAVSHLSTLTEYCLPLVKKDGVFISSKGPSISSEIAESENAIKKLGGVIEKTDYIKVPYSELNHNLVIINKIENTSLKYPRKTAKIKKKPL